MVSGQISPFFYAYSICFFYLVFALAWWQDSKIHHHLLNNHEHAKELQTHTLILYPSILMEISLIAMFWYPLHALPLFIACYLTRTIQEFIDEARWHSIRCEKKESILHLIMWISVHAKTALMFMWGFVDQFNGWNQLPIIFWVIFAAILLFNFIIACKEIKLNS